jgi:predicted ArsR family transcriptional regulator
VLFAVRRLGEASVDEVAEGLAMTTSGARQHLVALLDAELVDATEVPRASGTRGRPHLAYHVTERADALFPKAYGALTNELLGYLDDEDPAVVERLFARRRAARVAAAQERLASKRSLKARVDEVARILDDDGYLATSSSAGRGRYRVTEHNCAIAAVAQRYGQACSSEIDFLRTVLPDAEVVRTHHMASGDWHCGYDITARSRR